MLLDGRETYREDILAHPRHLTEEEESEEASCCAEAAESKATVSVVSHCPISMSMTMSMSVSVPPYRAQFAVYVVSTVPVVLIPIILLHFL